MSLAWRSVTSFVQASAGRPPCIRREQAPECLYPWSSSSHSSQLHYTCHVRLHSVHAFTGTMPSTGKKHASGHPCCQSFTLHTSRASVQFPCFEKTDSPAQRSKVEDDFQLQEHCIAHIPSFLHWLSCCQGRLVALHKTSLSPLLCFSRVPFTAQNHPVPL